MSERKTIDTKDMRKALGQLRAELDAALGAVSDNLSAGITFRLGNCTYNPDERTFKFALTGAFPGAADAKVEKERDIYQQLAKVMALPSNAYNSITGKFDQTPGHEMPPLDTVLRINGENVTIIGALGGRAKYNVLVRKADGTRTRYQDEAVARIWARTKIAAHGKGGAA